MPKQFEFDFIAESAEARLKRLAKEYRDKVGVDPLLRCLDETAIRAGIADPEAERARLYEIDTNGDHEDTRRTYQQ